MNLSPTQNDKLTTWRQSNGFSTHSLALEIQNRMTKDYPDGFPKGVKITQTDIRRAESFTSQKSFHKVTKALYKYFNVESDYFGDYQNPLKQYQQKSANHAVMETTISYQSDNIRALQQLVETQAKLIHLLEAENSRLKKQIEQLNS